MEPCYFTAKFDLLYLNCSLEDDASKIVPSLNTLLMQRIHIILQKSRERNFAEEGGKGNGMCVNRAVQQVYFMTFENRRGKRKNIGK